MSVNRDVKALFDHLRERHGVAFKGSDFWRMSAGSLYDVRRELREIHEDEHPKGDVHEVAS